MPQTPTSNPAIDKLIAQTDSLYSLPAVALEVLRLTESDTVDVAALKESIERDPALVVKILKVVNSSLFGLSGQVSSLTQALALLGARPLKMLVLGFSLPDKLLAEASSEQLERFWRASLTRAIVARDLATEHFSSSDAIAADEAFVAGLLQDVGVLVLLGQLGEPYTKLLQSAAEEGTDATQLERDSLGFTRSDLTAALGRNWQLPSPIVDAIAGEGESLARPLELAELLVRLVVDRQLDALPALIERGEAYCGLSNQQIRTMVESLEQRVLDLAEAMMMSLDSDADYLQVITDAHARLALLAENPLDAPAEFADDRVCEELLAESRELQLAMRQFLKGQPKLANKLLRAEGSHAPADSTSEPFSQPPSLDPQERERLLDALGKLARQTRASRHALSLALVEIDADVNDRTIDRQLRAAMSQAAELLADRRTARLTLSPQVVAVLLPAVGRGETVEFLQRLEQLLANPAATEPSSTAEQPTTPKQITARAGVASIELVPNRFKVENLIAAAEGCLAAAKPRSSTCIRSIEVY